MLWRQFIFFYRVWPLYEAGYELHNEAEAVFFFVVVFFVDHSSLFKLLSGSAVCSKSKHLSVQFHVQLRSFV